MYSTVFKTEQILVGSQNEQNIRTACFCLGRSEDAARGWSWAPEDNIHRPGGHDGGWGHCLLQHHPGVLPQPQAVWQPVPLGRQLWGDPADRQAVHVAISYNWRIRIRRLRHFINGSGSDASFHKWIRIIQSVNKKKYSFCFTYFLFGAELFWVKLNLNFFLAYDIFKN